MAAAVKTQTIAQFGTDVANLLGSAYSAYNTRAIELLPQAIKEVFQSGNWDQEDVYADGTTQGAMLLTVTFSGALTKATQTVSIYASTAGATNYILHTGNIAFDIKNGTTQAYVSPIPKQLEKMALNYASVFDDGVPAVYYYIESNQITLVNPTAVTQSGTAKVWVFSYLYANETSYDLSKIMNNRFYTQCVNTCVEILKREIAA